MKELKITIDPAGRVTTEAIGFNGVGCALAVSKVTDALGGQSKSEDKPEMQYVELTQEGSQQICG